MIIYISLERTFGLSINWCYKTVWITLPFIMVEFDWTGAEEGWKIRIFNNWTL